MNDSIILCCCCSFLGVFTLQWTPNPKGQTLWDRDLSVRHFPPSMFVIPLFISFPKICYPFPRWMQVQRMPDELSSPCCEMREKNLSPGDQNLSLSPPGLFAAQSCQSNGFCERQTAIPGLSLTSCCGSSPPGKGRKPKPKSKPSAGAEFPFLFSPVHLEVLNEHISKWDRKAPRASTWSHWIQAWIPLWKGVWNPQVRTEVWGGFSHWKEQKFSHHMESEGIGWGRVSSKSEHNQHYSCRFPRLSLEFALGLGLFSPLRAPSAYLCYVLADFF